MTLCLDSDCFVVVELTKLEALTTNDTVFVVANDSYVPLEYSENVTSPDV